MKTIISVSGDSQALTAIVSCNVGLDSASLQRSRPAVWLQRPRLEPLFATAFSRRHPHRPVKALRPKPLPGALSPWK